LFKKAIKKHLPESNNSKKKVPLTPSLFTLQTGLVEHVCQEKEQGFGEFPGAIWRILTKVIGGSKSTLLFS